jgi:hypothetical protein
MQNWELGAARHQRVLLSKTQNKKPEPAWLFILYPFV